MKVLRDEVYDEESGCRADVYLPENFGYDTVVYFHGGGMEAGDKADANVCDIAEYFCEKGYAFVSVNYTLYPAAVFPGYLKEGALAVRFALNNVAGKGGSGRVAVSGQSAGAWISLMLCFDRRYFDGCGVDGEKIFAWIIDSAQTTSHYNVMKYEKGLSPALQRIDELAPLYYVDETTRFSRMLLIYYEKDMPCRLQQNELLYAAIKNLNRDSDVEKICLKGGHCRASCVKEPDGTYEFATVALDFLER